MVTVGARAGDAPVLRTNAQVQSEDQNWSTSIQGTTPDYHVVRNWTVDEGVPLSQTDVESGAKVAVLGATVADQLFGGGEAVGQLVRIKGVPFQVVGVLTKKGQSGAGQDYDDTVLVPVSTFKQRIVPSLGNYLSGTIYVAAKSSDATDHAEKQITDLLRDRHHLGENADPDFSIRNLAELASGQQDSAQTLEVLLIGIALVSLAVGGIGIMNIMLVSVTERTREIGIRMAVGAKPSNILMQFMVEALTLSTIGGLTGIALGLFAANRIATAFKWPMVVNPVVIIGAVAFAAAVALVFGLYPARKASRLDPIEALRYE